MADIDYNKMQEAFERALKARGGSSGGFSGGSTPTPSPSASGAGVAALGSGLKKGFDEATQSGIALGKTFGDVAGKLVTGGVRISDVTGSLTENFKAAGYSGSVLGKALGGMSGAVGEVVKYVEEGVDSFRELSKTGASFNNSIIELRSNAAQTRMTLAEYGQVVKENSGLFTTFGGTVSQGAKQFTEFSKKFFDSPVADELRLMGYNTKDINELLALQTTTMRINGKLDAETTKREIEAARNLAVEMDAVSKLTGQSRKEQEEKLRKDRENGQMMAAIDLAMMKGGKDVQKAFDGMTTAASMGGKDFQRLQQEIFAMGRPSEEMAAKFAMIGGEAQKLMMQAAEQAKKGNTAQAQLLTQQAAAAAAQTAGSETFQNLAAQGSKDFGDLSIQLRKNRVQLEEIAEREKLDLTTSEGLAKANELRMKMAKDEQKADEDNIAKSAILAEARAKDTYTAINNALVTPLQKEVNPALKGFADKLKEINTVPGGFRGTAEKKIEGIVEPVKEGYRRVQDRNTPGAGPAPSAELTDEQRQQAQERQGRAAGYRAGREAANVPQRNKGTLGETGKLFENFGSGTLVELHGMESVMRPEDMSKVVEQSLGAVAKLAMPTENKQSFADGMADFHKRTAAANGIDISKVSKEISTTISSATTGGSTTTKRVQSDDSKSAEKELATQKQEYAKEREALRLKVREQLGPDAKSSDVRKAMRESDEGKAIEAKYQETFSALEKRIDAGINYEVERKTEAFEETKKTVEKELSIVQTAKAKIKEVSEDASNEEILSAKKLTDEQKKIRDEERENIFKAAEAHKNIVGKAVGDMTDDAIEKLLPAGAKVEDFYIDMKGNLQSFAADSAKKLQEVIENEKAVEEAQKTMSDAIGKVISVSDVKSAQQTISNTPSPQFDEFAGLDEAIAKQSALAQVPSIDLNALNLPGFGPMIKSAAATIPAEMKKPVDATGRSTTEAAAAEEAKKADTKKAESAKGPASSATGKTATLDDVVKELAMLNSKIASLTEETKQIGSKQERATRASSQNIYQR